MDLETALSASVQLDRREGILRGALLRRRAELRKSWKHLISSECLESLGAIAPEVESLLSGQRQPHLRPHFTHTFPPHPPKTPPSTPVTLRPPTSTLCPCTTVLRSVRTA